MLPILLALSAVVISLLVGAALVWRPFRAARREARFAVACRDFHRQRERLEAKFVQLGTIGPKPDAPRWTDCQFDDDVAYARNRSSGELSAFVAVSIEMEDIGQRSFGSSDAVGNLRAATAVFRFNGKHWETEGRAIFNLTPTEAIHFYHRDLVMVGQEVAHRP
ncbi:MAG: hypothetical protein ABIK89_21585 [Planctomycetota bacterium]